MGASKTTDPQVSLDQRLAAARTAAAQARQALDGIKGRLTTAVREQRFGDAEAIKNELPDAEHAWATAAAEQRALEGVLEHLARERQEHEAALAAERRRHQATAQLNASAEREALLMDELQAARAELVAGVAALQQTTRRGYTIEQQVRQERANQAQARMDVGETTSVPPYISAPNLLSSFVERSPALTAILHGTALPS